MKPLRIVCIADTHTRHREVEVPEGDVLIVAGDFTGTGRAHEIEDFDSWLAVQPCALKIVVAGNHDWLFYHKLDKARRLLPHATYLQDSGIDIRPALVGRDPAEGWTVSVYGSPWQPKFYDWAFDLERNGHEIADRWRRIPTGVGILITHTAPKGVLDYDMHGDRAGCELLAIELERIRPRLHVFGHFHSVYGSLQRDGTTYVNATICDDAYEVHRQPVVIEYPLPKELDNATPDR